MRPRQWPPSEQWPIAVMLTLGVQIRVVWCLQPLMRGRRGTKATAPQTARNNKRDADEAGEWQERGRSPEGIKRRKKARRRLRRRATRSEFHDHRRAFGCDRGGPFAVHQGLPQNHGTRLGWALWCLVPRQHTIHPNSRQVWIWVRSDGAGILRCCGLLRWLARNVHEATTASQTD